MKTLCLYYTRTDLTKTAMEQVAEITGADLYEYTDGKDRSGVLGYIGACFASVFGKLPEVTIKGDPDLGAYDRVVIGMPIWAEGPCIVGRALISQYRDRLPKEVYYVVTHMAAADYMNKIRKLDSLLGRASAGQFSVQTKNNDYVKEVRAYAESLKK